MHSIVTCDSNVSTPSLSVINLPRNLPTLQHKQVVIFFSCSRDTFFSCSFPSENHALFLHVLSSPGEAGARQRFLQQEKCHEKYEDGDEAIGRE